MLGHVRLPIRGLGAEYDQPLEGPGGVQGLFVGEIFDTDEVNDSRYALEIVSDPLYSGRLAWHDGFWNVVSSDPKTGITRIYMDHLAIKPLYYDLRQGIIASEMRALEAVRYPLGRELNLLYISNVLKWGYDPMGQTPFADVVKLEPGMCYAFQKGQLINSYHYFPLTPREGHLRHDLEVAVQNRLVSDLPVSVLCSGGLDSTIVALLAAQSGNPTTVFHIDNDEGQYLDDIPWPSNVVVKKLELPLRSLPLALEATEDPVDLGSVLPQYALGAALKAEGFHVVLTGDGADELFGGYRRAKEYDSQYSDIMCELVHYHLPRLDKTMMAHTIELRSPFLAPRVIRHALTIPHSERRNKEALKEAFQDLVPERILMREKKALKTQAVAAGGIQYRHAVLEHFYRRLYHDTSSTRVSQ
jgi:asparagine synthase (glutamine-hydrolysing)